MEKFSTPYEGALSALEMQIRSARQEQERIKTRIGELRQRREDVYMRRAESDPIVLARAAEHSDVGRPFPKAVYHALLRSEGGFDARELVDLFPSRAPASATRAAPVVDDVIFLQSLGLVYLTKDYRWVPREQVTAER